MFKKEYAPRTMVQGNWKCSKCGAEITELPFEPSGDLPIYSASCHRERMSERRGSFQRKIYEGDWKCAKCGVEIKTLPFQPREGQEILCRECYRSQRDSK